MPVYPNIEVNGRTLLMMMRGNAMESYSAVETSLCQLLAWLLGTDPAAAGIVFYKINNARSRNTILEKLLKRRHGGGFNCFWNSLESRLRALAETRNSIAHWHTVIEIDGEDDGSIDIGDLTQGTASLYPSNVFAGLNDDAKIGYSELQKFADQCDFIERSITCFTIVLKDSVGQAEFEPPQAWRDICQQPVAYPPPDNHPLSRNYKEPETPHPPSAE